jgi:signal transduction histidine kinase
MERCKHAATRAAPAPFTELKLLDILSEAKTKCDPTATRAGHRISVETFPNITIRGDSHQLEMVFVNLIENSIKAMESPGKITVSCEPNVQQQRICISVQDKGKGMSLEKIRDVLGQPAGDNSLSRSKRVPLGVAWSRFVIEQHGGELSYESVVSEHTTARVVLPYIRLSIPSVSDAKLSSTIESPRAS